MIDRFTDALYAPGELSRFLDMPASTLSTWIEPATSSGHRSLITARPATARGEARVPFIGLAEAYTLRAIRRANLPMQRIRPALERLAHEGALPHALASERLYTKGAEVLLDIARTDRATADAVEHLVVVRSGRPVLNEVIRDYLSRVTYHEGYARVVPLPVFGEGVVIVDPTRGFGQPIFSSSGARVEDAIDLFKAAVDVNEVADEFAISPDELQQALRGHLSLAA